MALSDRGMKARRPAYLAHQQAAMTWLTQLIFLFSSAVFCYPAVQPMEDAG
jgi:hypothetical protein